MLDLQDRVTKGFLAGISDCFWTNTGSGIEPLGREGEIKVEYI